MKLFRKLPRISKRTVLIASVLVLIVGIPAAYYLWASRQEDTRAWYDSNWMYRRAVQVNNPSSTVSNADVLVTVDTASLISAGKLQSDCDDLRFLDSDDSTTLSYWIEGGCNTQSTQVWTRIPSLPSGGKTIYMYYGNPSANSAQMEWSGEFSVLRNTSCPTGWTNNTDFDNLFIRGSSTYGTYFNGQHNHNGSANCTTGTPSSNLLHACWTGASGTLARSTHTHVAYITVNNTTITPPYLNMVVCKNSQLNTTGNTIISIFDTSVPSGWTRFTPLDGRYPRGYSSYGSTGGSNTHTHTVSGSNTGVNSTNVTDAVEPFIYTVADMNHTHPTSGTTSTSGNNNIPYIDVVYGSGSNGPIAGMIIMASDTPPLGWTRFSAFDNRFTRGASTYLASSSSGSTHNHTSSISVSQTSGTSTSRGGTSAGTTGPCTWSTHLHAGCTATFTSQQANPPYRTTLFIQRKASVTTVLNIEEVANAIPTEPTSLLTEEQINPSNVIDTTPEFSAVFNDPDAGDLAISYQIQVNTASDFTGTAMWDSGKTSVTAITNGNRSPLIPYNGTALTLDGTTYYWRIKFWDQDDAEGVWSATAHFTMATPPEAPTELQTEGQVNPIKVYPATPSFTAIFNDPDADL